MWKFWSFSGVEERKPNLSKVWVFRKSDKKCLALLLSVLWGSDNLQLTVIYDRSEEALQVETPFIMVWGQSKCFRMLPERKCVKANNYPCFCVVMLWEQNPSSVLLWSWLNLIYCLQILNPLPERPEWVLWNFLKRFLKWDLIWKKEISNYNLREFYDFLALWKMLIPLHVIYSHPTPTEYIPIYSITKVAHRIST